MVQMVNGLGSFFRRFIPFVKPFLYSGVEAVGKEAVKQVPIK